MAIRPSAVWQQQADQGGPVQQPPMALLAFVAEQAEASPTSESIPANAATAMQRSRKWRGRYMINTPQR